jgi:adenylosuccinate lyase
VEEIKAKANFDPQRVLEIEAEVRHDMIAFLTNVNEYVGDAGRYIHLGLTSSDVLDTAFALQLIASLDLILQQLEKTISQKLTTEYFISLVNLHLKIGTVPVLL